VSTWLGVVVTIVEEDSLQYMSQGRPSGAFTRAFVDYMRGINEDVCALSKEHHHLVQQVSRLKQEFGFEEQDERCDAISTCPHLFDELFRRQIQQDPSKV
jgi:hypothetical protein